MVSGYNLDEMKNKVVTSLFVDSADQDYVLARMAYHKAMFTGFFWGAGQAIEKYLKASLLLNGQSSKPYGHDLIKLFDAVTAYAADLLPEKLTQPVQLGGIHWREETPAEFISRVEQYGNPGNRYNIFGHSAHHEDLCHLDQLVFALRRLTCTLDAYPFLGEPNDLKRHPRTVRDILADIPAYSPRRHGGSRPPKLTSDKSDDELRHMALKLNFPFAPDDYDHDRDGTKIGFSMAQPVLYTLVLQPAEQQQGASGHADAADLADWVVENIVLPKNVRKQLEDAAARLRTRD